MMLAEDSSFIDDENQGKVVFHWFVVFCRWQAQRSQSKALWLLFQHLARTDPSVWSAQSGPKTTWKKMHFFHERKSIYMMSPENSTLCFFCGLGQTLSVQTHDECPSGAGVYKGTGVALVNVWGKFTKCPCKVNKVSWTQAKMQSNW